MSGVTVIRHLLANNAGLGAVVPGARIVVGTVPQGSALPAIGIANISDAWGTDVSRQSGDCTERVQITVMASSSLQREQVMKLVRSAVPRTRGSIADVDVESIVRGSAGPDFEVEVPTIYMKSRDFIVRFTE